MRCVLLETGTLASESFCLKQDIVNGSIVVTYHGDATMTYPATDSTNKRTIGKILKNIVENSSDIKSVRTNLDLVFGKGVINESK